jgi:thymidine kinase
MNARAEIWDGLKWSVAPCFSGKSEELIRRLRRAEIARQRVQIFKRVIDQRYSSDHIVSHDDSRIHSASVSTALRSQAARPARGSDRHR